MGWVRISGTGWWTGVVDGAGSSVGVLGAPAAGAYLARTRAAGIGPMMFGANGIPGVPSTIGAPEPLGSDTK